MVDPLSIYLFELGISFATGLFLTTLILLLRRKKPQDRTVYWILSIALDFVVMGILESIRTRDFRGWYYSSYWFVFSFVFVFFFFFLREISYIITSKNWPTTSGVITEARIHTNYNQRVNDKPVKEFKIKYSYSVNNNEYENELLKFFAYRRITKLLLYWNTSEKSLIPLLEKYQSGEQVTVFYNSRNPMVSVLEPGKFNYRPLIIQLISFLILAFYLYPIGPITSVSIIVKVLTSYIYFQIVQTWIRTPTSLTQRVAPSYSLSPEYSNDLNKDRFRLFPERVYCENCGTLLQDEKYPCPLCSTQ
ncbi:MAG: DUF3592 domain-containing protein [Candidatus Hodarchaeota archaeon]